MNSVIHQFLSPSAKSLPITLQEGYQQLTTVCKTPLSQINGSTYFGALPSSAVSEQKCSQQKRI